MTAMTQLHAKDPQRPFDPDLESLLSVVTPALEEAVDRWARPVYDEVVAC